MTPLVAPVVLTAALTAAVLIAIVAVAAIDQSQLLSPSRPPARNDREPPFDQRGPTVYECSTDDDRPGSRGPEGLVHQLIVYSPTCLGTSPGIVPATPPTCR